MKKLLFAILALLIAGEVFAQRTVPVYPEETATRTTYIVLAPGADSTITFKFGRKRGPHGYSGLLTALCWVKEHGTYTGDNDSLYAAGAPTFWDDETGAYEHAPFSSVTGANDTTAIFDNLNWSGSTATNLTLSDPLNTRMCDGYAVRLRNLDSDTCAVRFELRKGDN